MFKKKDKKSEKKKRKKILLLHSMGIATVVYLSVIDILCSIIALIAPRSNHYSFIVGIFHFI